MAYKVEFKCNQQSKLIINESITFGAENLSSFFYGIEPITCLKFNGAFLKSERIK